MSSESVLKCVNSNLEHSPCPKRARYDLNAASASRWTLSNNELVLHSVYDLGIGRLDSDTDSEVDDYAREISRHFEKSPDSTEKQLKLIQSTVPDQTVQKLASGDLDDLLEKESNPPVLKDEETNFFDLLSDEVVLQIFQKLTKLELSNIKLVCRRFFRLSEDESLWTRMDLCNRKLEPGAFGIIMSRQVIILRLARSNILYPPILPDVKAASPDYRCRLMYLDLSMATITTKSMAIIFSKCRRIKKLSLENVPVNDDVLIALSNNTEIEVLNFAMSTGIECNGLKYLLKNCKKIKELNMAWTYMSSETIEFLCENLPSTLDRFNFSGCRKQLYDKSIGSLVTKCPHIRELDLSDCTSLTGDAVRLITVLEDLNFLALSRCYLIPFRSLLQLRKVKSLSYLDVHGGYIDIDELKVVKETLGSNVNINKFKFSSVARPTVGLRRSSIWNMRVRD